MKFNIDLTRILTLLKTKPIVLLLLTVLTIFGIFNYVSPKRSVESYCKTYKAETEKLHNKWKDQSEQYVKSDSFSALMGSLALVAGAPRDFEIMFNKLSKVAPEEIEDDVITMRDAFKKSSEQSISGNFLQDLGSALLLSFRTSGAQARVDEFTTANCGLPSSFASNSLISPTPTGLPAQKQNILQTNGVKENSLKLWEKNKSGIIAILGSEIVLINPDNFKIIARQTLPKTQGRTPGGDSGKSYTLNTHYGIGIRDFDSNYRYIPLVFDKDRDDKGHVIFQVGYYDMKDNTVNEIPLPEIDEGIIQGNESPFINPINRTTMLYKKAHSRGWDNSDWNVINFSNKEITTYSGDIRADILTESSDVGDFASNKFVLNPSLTSLVKLGEEDVDFNQNNARNLNHGLACEPIQLLSDKSLFCINEEKDQLYTVDITNIVENKTETDDPTSYDYRPGVKHYVVPDPVALLPDTPRYIDNIIVSPDGKKIIFGSADGPKQFNAMGETTSGKYAIYSVNVSDKKLIKIADQKAPNFLEWR